jgi:hypothetical protein
MQHAFKTTLWFYYIPVTYGNLFAETRNVCISTMTWYSCVQWYHNMWHSCVHISLQGIKSFYVTCLKWYDKIIKLCWWHITHIYGITTQQDALSKIKEKKFTQHYKTNWNENISIKIWSIWHLSDRFQSKAKL